MSADRRPYGRRARSRARRIATPDDARARARRVLPRMVFDLVDGGADGEVTLRANRSAFDDYLIRGRMAVHVAAPDLSTEVLGVPVTMPVFTSPTALNNLVNPKAELAVVGAAARNGVIAALATGSSTALEDVAESVPGHPLWFQLYFYSGREGAEVLSRRAHDAGYRALVITVDTPVPGNKEKDTRNRVVPPITVSPRHAMRFATQVLPRPRWLYRFVRGGMKLRMAHGVRPGLGRADSLSVNQLTSVTSNHPPTWEDVAWLRSIWQRPLIVKGILTREDARRAVQAGADGVIVSNHGGRQLDSGFATLRALEEVVGEVGDEITVIMDGGVRRGTDVVKALAIGAKAVMFGRPYLYGLGWAGTAGVDRVLDLMRVDLTRTLALMGCPSVKDLDPTWIEKK